MKLLNLHIELRSPIVIMPSWKHLAIQAAKKGQMLESVKLIRTGLGITLKDAKTIYDIKFSKFYRHP